MTHSLKIRKKPWLHSDTSPHPTLNGGRSLSPGAVQGPGHPGARGHLHPSITHSALTHRASAQKETGELFLFQPESARSLIGNPPYPAPQRTPGSLSDGLVLWLVPSCSGSISLGCVSDGSGEGSRKVGKRDTDTPH